MLVLVDGPSQEERDYFRTLTRCPPQVLTFCSGVAVLHTGVKGVGSHGTRRGGKAGELGPIAAEEQEEDIHKPAAVGWFGPHEAAHLRQYLLSQKRVLLVT